MLLIIRFRAFECEIEKYCRLLLCTSIHFVIKLLSSNRMRVMWIEFGYCIGKEDVLVKMYLFCISVTLSEINEIVNH
jgi:hypothetical protein